MINVLKKYWFLILVVIVAINFLGFKLINESIRISDAFEHIESDKVIDSLKRKDLFYTIFIDFVLIIDVCIILLISYLIIRNIIKNLNVSKK